MTRRDVIYAKATRWEKGSNMSIESQFFNNPVHQYRVELGDALRQAAHFLSVAERNLDNLTTRDDFHDVAYVDGYEGDDMRAFLTDAARMVRAAQTIDREVARLDQNGQELP